MANGYLTPWRRASLAESAPFGSGLLLDLHRQMNRVFDQLFERDGSTGGLFSAGIAPALDLHADDKQVEVTAELPGVKEQDIELSIENGVLTLSGEKRSERTDENGYSERSYGRFRRAVTLPADVDEDKASAEFREGVLRVTFPRSEAKSRGKRIAIGSSGQQPRLEAQNDAEPASRQAAAEEPQGGTDQQHQG